MAGYVNAMENHQRPIDLFSLMVSGLCSKKEFFIAHFFDKETLECRFCKGWRPSRNGRGRFINKRRDLEKHFFQDCSKVKEITDAMRERDIPIAYQECYDDWKTRTSERVEKERITKKEKRDRKRKLGEAMTTPKGIFRINIADRATTSGISAVASEEIGIYRTSTMSMSANHSSSNAAAGLSHTHTHSHSRVSFDGHGMLDWISRLYTQGTDGALKDLLDNAVDATNTLGPAASAHPVHVLLEQHLTGINTTATATSTSTSTSKPTGPFKGEQMGHTDGDGENEDEDEDEDDVSVGLSIQNSAKSVKPIDDIVTFALSGKKGDTSTIGENGVGLFTGCFQIAEAALIVTVTHSSASQTESKDEQTGTGAGSSTIVAVAALSRALQRPGTSLLVPRVTLTLTSQTSSSGKGKVDITAADLSAAECSQLSLCLQGLPNCLTLADLSQHIADLDQRCCTCGGGFDTPAAFSVTLFGLRDNEGQRVGAQALAEEIAHIIPDLFLRDTSHLTWNVLGRCIQPTRWALLLVEMQRADVEYRRPEVAPSKKSEEKEKERGSEKKSGQRRGRKKTSSEDIKVTSRLRVKTKVSNRDLSDELNRRAEQTQPKITCYFGFDPRYSTASRCHIYSAGRLIESYGKSTRGNLHINQTSNDCLQGLTIIIDDRQRYLTLNPTKDKVLDDKAFGEFCKRVGQYARAYWHRAIRRACRGRKREMKRAVAAMKETLQHARTRIHQSQCMRQQESEQHNWSDHTLFQKGQLQADNGIGDDTSDPNISDPRSLALTTFDIRKANAKTYVVDEKSIRPGPHTHFHLPQAATIASADTNGNSKGTSKRAKRVRSHEATAKAQKKRKLLAKKRSEAAAGKAAMVAEAQKVLLAWWEGPGKKGGKRGDEGDNRYPYLHNTIKPGGFKGNSLKQNAVYFKEEWLRPHKYGSNSDSNTQRAQSARRDGNGREWYRLMSAVDVTPQQLARCLLDMEGGVRAEHLAGPWSGFVSPEDCCRLRLPGMSRRQWHTFLTAYAHADCLHALRKEWKAKTKCGLPTLLELVQQFLLYGFVLNTTTVDVDNASSIGTRGSNIASSVSNTLRNEPATEQFNLTDFLMHASLSQYEPHLRQIGMRECEMYRILHAMHECSHLLDTQPETVLSMRARGRENAQRQFTAFEQRNQEILD